MEPLEPPLDPPLSYILLGMGGFDILAYDYCKAKISRLSRLLLQLYLC